MVKKKKAKVKDQNEDHFNHDENKKFLWSK